MATNGEVDIVAADLTMTSARANALEFTVPYLAAQVTVLLKKEKKRGGRHGGGEHGVGTKFLIDSSKNDLRQFANIILICVEFNDKY